VISSRDPWIFVLLLALWPALTVYILDSGIAEPNTDYSFLLPFMPSVLAVPLSWSIYRRYRSLPEELHSVVEANGFEVISQRGLSFWEVYELLARPGTKPVYWPPRVYFTRFRFKTKYRRVFMVRDQQSVLYEIPVVATFAWDNKLHMEILPKKLVEIKVKTPWTLAAFFSFPWS
jgi:hypothetical protein